MGSVGHSKKARKKALKTTNNNLFQKFCAKQ